MQNPEINIKNILKEIRVYENGPAVDAMERMGLKYNRNFGVSLSYLKKIADKYKPNHELAKILRNKNIRETRILAELIEDKNKISSDQIENIVQNIDNTELAEQTCINLLEKVHSCRHKVTDWIKSDKEFVTTTGYILISRLALINKDIDNDFFETCTKKSIEDSENESFHIRKSLARALRQIALRNDYLKSYVLLIMKQIKSNNSKLSDFVYEEVVPLLEYNNPIILFSY